MTDITKSQPNRYENRYMLNMMVVLHTLVSDREVIERRLRPWYPEIRRDLGLLIYLTKKIQEELMTTFPDKRNAYYQRMAEVGEMVIDMPGAVPRGRHVLMDVTDAAAMAEAAMRGECAMCMRDGDAGHRPADRGEPDRLRVPQAGQPADTGRRGGNHMNKVMLIGNLTRDPETGATKDGVGWTRFTIAVRKRFRRDGEQDADFVRVTAWRQLGESCAKYLAKGRKVAVVGPVSCRTYVGNDGVTRASLEVKADEVEFLTPRQDGQQPGAPAYHNAQPQYQNAQPAYQNAQPAYQNAPVQQQPQQRVDQRSGYPVIDDEELPF